MEFLIQKVIKNELKNNWKLTFDIEIVQVLICDHEIATLANLVLVEFLDLGWHHYYFSGFFKKHKIIDQIIYNNIENILILELAN